MPGDYIALYEKSATVYSVLAGSLGLSIRRLLSTDSFWPTDHSSAKNLSLWITLLRELFSILFSIYTWFERIEILKIIHVKIIHVKLRIPCLNFLKKKIYIFIDKLPNICRWPNKRLYDISTTLISIREFFQMFSKTGILNALNL